MKGLENFTIVLAIAFLSLVGLMLLPGSGLAAWRTATGARLSKKTEIWKPTEPWRGSDLPHLDSRLFRQARTGHRRL